jgi:hypothetical protein
MPLRFFIAGIYQGSLTEGIHDQSYRTEIRNAILAGFPDAIVDCPAEEVEAGAPSFWLTVGPEVYMDAMRRAGRADVLVAFAPEASMSTAIEMWEAFRNQRVVLCVSPLKDNWTVKFLSHDVFASIDELQTYIEDGRLQAEVDKNEELRQAAAGS